MAKFLVCFLLICNSALCVTYSKKHKGVRDAIRNLRTDASIKEFQKIKSRIERSKDYYADELMVALAVQAKRNGLPKVFLDSVVEAVLEVQVPSGRQSLMDQYAVQVGRIVKLAEVGLYPEAVSLFNKYISYCHLGEIQFLVEAIPGAKFSKWTPPGKKSPVDDECKIELKEPIERKIAFETRCGWVVSDAERKNISLRDKDGEWKIKGLDFDLSIADRNHGCACVDAFADSSQKQILKITDARSLSIEKCRNDKSLPKDPNAEEGA